MITWTPSAKSELDDYLTDMHSTLRASGADPAEVTDDIPRHVDEELAASQLGVVTTEDVGRILRRIGARATKAERDASATFQCATRNPSPTAAGIQAQAATSRAPIPWRHPARHHPDYRAGHPHVRRRVL